MHRITPLEAHRKMELSLGHTALRAVVVAVILLPAALGFTPNASGQAIAMVTTERVQSATGDETGNSITVTYQCDSNGELIATFLQGDPPAARVEVGDSVWTLPLGQSGSGSRYTDGTVTFWLHGNQATFDSPKLRLDCLATDPGRTNAANLETGVWRLVALTVNGTRSDIPAGSSITAAFKDGRVTGRGVCNNFTASYTVSNINNLAIGPVGATKMMCRQNADIESLYFAGLAKATRFAINVDMMQLTSPIGALLFTRAPAR